MKKLIRRCWSWFSGLPLRTKVSLAFAVSMSLVVLVNLYMYMSINRMVDTLDTIYDSNISLSTLSDTLDSVQDSIYEYLTAKGSDTLEGYYRNVQDYQRCIENLNDRPTDNLMLLSEKNIRTMSQEYLALAEEAVTAKRGRDIEQYKASYDQATRLYGYIADTIESLNDQQFRVNSESYALLLQSLGSVELLSLVLLVLAILLNFLLLLFFVGAMTRPLTLLTQRADQVSQGNLNVELLPAQGSDEFAVVARAFNQMVVSLNDNIRQIKAQMEGEKRLMEERLLMETHLKEAELRSLQAQINPHFLYNTLNAGAQLAMLEGAEDTCLFIENLADFFRYNVKKVGELSTLEEELRQVENYLYVINVRFSGEIHFARTGLPVVPKLTLPGLVLQPLVENAVEHGLREVEWEKRVSIDVARGEEGYLISVIDNGTGMDPAVARRILSGTPEEEPADGHTSVGLRNVLARLRLFYGRQDVMRITSNDPEQGTTIRICLPFDKEERDHV
ncbi:MAG: histidine kinase [Candidatus Onthomonas sp.]